jgi:ribosomal protein S18 acetylase RimI-like enzyme
MPVLIRLMQPHEVAEVRRLILSIAAQLFQPEAPDAFIARHAHTLADVDNYRRDYSQPDGLFLVVVDGVRIIGTAAIRRFDDQTAELRRMWLLEPYQGQGIGYRLWLQVSTFARSAGYQRICLTTDEENVRALSFYKRLGFRLIANYRESGEGIFMELALNDTDLYQSA